MKIRHLQRILTAAMIGLVAATLLGGCNDSGDAVSAAKKADKLAGMKVLGIEETRATAEEGFIYGLPIVMNYAVMYEYSVDPNSGQYKASFNTINNDSSVFTYKDTAVVTPNSDTPYSMLWLDLRAEPMVISVPAIEKSRYYSVQLEDGNTFNYGYIGSRATGNAFWSVTMYDGKTQLLIKNPIDRYLINSPMLPEMKKNADGSLTIYIQKDSPGAAKQSNWLPAPDDTIYLVMRLYWPKTEEPSILPPGEGTWQPPALFEAS